MADTTRAEALGRGDRGGTGGEGMGENGSTPLRVLTGWKAAALPVVAGIAIGIVTLILQGQLPGAWGHIANTGGPWLLGAFFVGAFMPSVRWAAPAGLVTLLGCLLGYYVAAHYFVDAAASVGIILFWVGIALVGGPLFGVAGRWWRGSQQWQRVAAGGLLGAAIIAEGVYLLQVVEPEDHIAGWVEIVVGVVLPLIIGHTTKDRLYGALAILPCLLLGAVAFVVMTFVYNVVF